MVVVNMMLNKRFRVLIAKASYIILKWRPLCSDSIGLIIGTDELQRFIINHDK